MNVSYELHRVDRIVADAVGEPGRRTFYLQARKEDELITLLVEKQQVALMAEAVERLLERLGDTAEAASEPGGLEEPLEPLFRVGQIAVGYDAEDDLVVVQCDEFDPEDDDDEDEDDDEGFGEVSLEDDPDLESGATVRMTATRDRMRAFAAQAARVVAAGRPTCRMCGQPIDPDEHFCPPSNGHRPVDHLP